MLRYSIQDNSEIKTSSFLTPYLSISLNGFQYVKQLLFWSETWLFGPRSRVRGPVTNSTRWISLHHSHWYGRVHGHGLFSSGILSPFNHCYLFFLVSLCWFYRHKRNWCTPMSKRVKGFLPFVTNLIIKQHNILGLVKLIYQIVRIRYPTQVNKSSLGK